MSQTKRVSAEVKIRLVEMYLQRKIGLAEAMCATGVKKASFQKWVAWYESEGAHGLMPAITSRVYSSQLLATGENLHLGPAKIAKMRPRKKSNEIKQPFQLCVQSFILESANSPVKGDL